MWLSIRLFSALGHFELAMLLCATAAGSESYRGNGAGTLIVTSTADSGAGSLRQALADANDGDTIQFDPALNGQTITLTSDELVIDSDITITGPGSSLLAVSRPSSAPRFRIFHVMPGHIVLMQGLTISGGYAEATYAGGILNDQATLTISNCIVTGNVSDSGGGGGIVSGGTLTIINSVVSNNGSGFTFGFPVGDGGGILGGGTMTIIHSTIANNTAVFFGGGINFGVGTITIIDSTISGNRAGSNFDGSGSGGGIYYIGGGGSTLTIENSTISGNIANGKNSGSGAGIDIIGGAVARISNSTISGNSAGVHGGGISINSGGATTTAVSVTNSTISSNQAITGGGIFFFGNNAALEIGNTILKTGSLGNNISNNGATVTSRGYNLSSDDAGGFLNAAGDQINTNPMLGPLQDNGGPTFTHNLLTGSPAINAGDPNFTPPPDTDQRGYDRIFNGRIDIGSLEVQPTPTPGPTPTATPTSTPVATATPSITPTPTSTPTTTPTPTATPVPNPAQALNISTRLRVETGNNVMIGGFIITGSASKNVAVRGIGPSLAGSGLSDVLADPTLELRDGSGALLFQNDDWQDNSAHAAELSALGLALQNPKESGIFATLTPGTYSALLTGKNGGAGTGLVEVYGNSDGAAAQLANISTRGFVQTGNNVMIGGFILGGSSGNTQVAVRGIGPSLSQSGLGNLLADPTLELRDGNGMLLISNDNWQDDSASAAQLTAHGLAPADPAESGIFAVLAQGAFTAILAGQDGGVGIGLVEIYNVQ